MKLVNLKNPHSPVLPSTPNFYWNEVLQNNLELWGYEDKDFNVIDDVDIMYNVTLQAIMMQEFRDWYGKGITVNSWYRPELYNDVVMIKHGYDAARNSDHKCINSSACDTNVPVHNDNISKWEEICKKYGVSHSIGLYTWGMHLGWRRFKNNRLWDNR